MGRKFHNNFAADFFHRGEPELRMLKSYLAFTSAVHHVLTRAYERLGAAIARKPLLTILLSLAAISLANLGLLKLRLVGDAIALWVPGASSAPAEGWIDFGSSRK